MVCRIRYKKNPDGSIYADGFKSPNEELSVNISDRMVGEINYHSMTIFNLKGELQHTCMEKTLNGAKKAAKKVLIALNVPFSQEVRPKVQEDEINKDARRQYENDNRGDK